MIHKDHQRRCAWFTRTGVQSRSDLRLAEKTEDELLPGKYENIYENNKVISRNSHRNDIPHGGALWLRSKRGVQESQTRSQRLRYKGVCRQHGKVLSGNFVRQNEP